MCAADIKSRGQRNFHSAIRRFKVMQQEANSEPIWKKAQIILRLMTGFLFRDTGGERRTKESLAIYSEHKNNRKTTGKQRRDGSLRPRLTCLCLANTADGGEH